MNATEQATRAPGRHLVVPRVLIFLTRTTGAGGQEGLGVRKILARRGRAILDQDRRCGEARLMAEAGDHGGLGRRMRARAAAAHDRTDLPRTIEGDGVGGSPRQRWRGAPARPDCGAENQRDGARGAHRRQVMPGRDRRVDSPVQAAQSGLPIKRLP